MSQWTHVCGVIRFDDLRKAMVRPGFEAVAQERFKIELPPAPTGSEGPAVVTWTHGQGDHEGYAYMSTATIFGDLRDFGLDDVQEIRDWWTQATTNLPQMVIIRSGILLVEVEGMEEPIVLQAKSS